MQRTPGVVDWLFNIGFFVVMNALLLGAAWMKSRRATGLFRGLYFVVVAPLVVFVWSLSWQWLFDATAANLWPLALAMWGLPCWIAWQLIGWIERRSREKAQPLS